MPQTISDWKADYTGADTNLPTASQSPTVGPELREIKAVIRGETLNKLFASDKIPAFYVSGDDTFYIDDTALTLDYPTDAEFLPGECLLLSLDDGTSVAEYWAVVKTVTLGPGIVTFSVFTGVHLNGTDGTLVAMRRSIYRVPIHPSHAAYGFYPPAMKLERDQTSSLPAKVWSIAGQCSGTNTVFKVAFPVKIPTGYQVRIFGTLGGFTGGTSAGSMRIQSITHDQYEATVTLQAAPGATKSVAWLFTMYIE